ncbi:MAG TPA: PH domain-containing protein [Nanoarchaeota archaeon]|nr:PH domain-containing protein [Nanoarchaeota archaeon]
MAIHEDLHGGERIVLETHPHRWVYAAWYAVGVVLMLSLYGVVIGMPYFAFGALVGLLVIMMAGFLRRADRYYVTDKRVIHEYRLITRKVSSAFYNKVQDLHFTQGPFERLMGIGTIHINTSGGSGIEITFKGITPAVKRIIEEHIGRHHVQPH